MRVTRVVVAGCLGTIVAFNSASAQLRSYAGVVAGNAQVTSTLACATSGYTIGAPWFAGLVLPNEGITACGLSGMVDDKGGLVGPVVSTAAASGPMVDNIGTFTGAASARANYWDLGVKASGVSTGGASTFTYRQAAAYASFTQDIAYSDPTIANGTRGFTNFTFNIDGLLRSIPQAPYGQQGDIYFSIVVNNSLWNSFIITALDNGLPSIRGASSGLPGSFVVTPGMAAGSATFTTTSNFNMVWGSNLRVEMAMYTTVSPCCYGASLNSDFYNSIRLAGVSAFAGSTPVSTFVVNTSSGLRLNANGIIPPSDPNPPGTIVPEPASVMLVLLGLAGITVVARRRTNRALLYGIAAR